MEEICPKNRKNAKYALKTKKTQNMPEKNKKTQNMHLYAQ